MVLVHIVEHCSSYAASYLELISLSEYCAIGMKQRQNVLERRIPSLEVATDSKEISLPIGQSRNGQPVRQTVFSIPRVRDGSLLHTTQSRQPLSLNSLFMRIISGFIGVNCLRACLQTL